MARTEMEKIRPRIEGMLRGASVLEPGCGVEKVAPWAISVDLHSPVADLRADVSPDTGDLLRALPGRLFDVVFSSHCLEHIRAPVLQTLRYWLGFVRPSGLMILYLPDERHYVFDAARPKLRNPDHMHYLTMDTFGWFVDQLAPSSLVEMSPDIGPDRHSFLCVLRKA